MNPSMSHGHGSASLDPAAAAEVAVQRRVEPGVQVPQPEPAAAEVQAPTAVHVTTVAPKNEEHPGF